MFVSADFLVIQYGIDEKIARFFADREPPADNLYWKDKLLYLRPQPGWLFIPLIADLICKCGIEKEQLLSEHFVTLMEKIGHISALQETLQISHNEALNSCMALVKDDHQNIAYHTHLISFMKGGTDNLFTALATPFKALHRGDYFLFALCAISFDDSLTEKLVKSWFALISTLLLLDDAEDLEIDRRSGDENAFIESGLDQSGIQTIKEMLSSSLRWIAGINKAMSYSLDQQFVDLKNRPYVADLLNL